MIFETGVCRSFLVGQTSPNPRRGMPSQQNDSFTARYRTWSQAAFSNRDLTSHGRKSAESKDSLVYFQFCTTFVADFRHFDVDSRTKLEIQEKYPRFSRVLHSEDATNPNESMRMDDNQTMASPMTAVMTRFVHTYGSAAANVRRKAIWVSCLTRYKRVMSQCL